MLIRLFRKAGATGHVFFLKNGTVRDKGLAYSGLFGPRTTIAVVPTTPQILNFAIDAQTSDNQRVVVQGSLTAILAPALAVRRFDFTVDPLRGGYVGNWLEVLKARVIEKVLRAVLDKVKTLTVKESTHSQSHIEKAVTDALGPSAFQTDGIGIESCSVPKIEPKDDEIRASVGAQERQTMLTESDKALHDRRLKASTNERALKQYEADTRLELERKNGELLDEQAKNTKKAAETDASATTIRLAPLKDVEAGKLLGAALMEAAKGGHVGHISITSELLAAISQK
jgi:hypothetical protein